MNLKQNLYEGPAEKLEHEHDYDLECIDWIARGAMLGRLQAILRLISCLPEFKKAKNIIDLGCGHGLFGIGLAQENPQLKVILFDRPLVAVIAQEYINKYGMQNRVKTLAGDYTKDDIGSNYDIAFCALSFSGNKEETIAFYRRIYEALNEEGLFITQTFTINDQRTEPLSILIWDLKELMTGHKHMHLFTDSEPVNIFEESGFVRERVIDMSEWSEMPMKTIIARKTGKHSS